MNGHIVKIVIYMFILRLNVIVNKAWLAYLRQKNQMISVHYAMYANIYIIRKNRQYRVVRISIVRYPK